LISPSDYDHDYILYLLASIILVAGVLIQLGEDGHEHVIYYISKSISRPPLKYNHDEKLTLEVFLAIQKMCHYILLRTTKVVEDSNPMQYFLICRKINGKFSQWIVILQEYNLELSTPKSKKVLVLTELITDFPQTSNHPPSIWISLTNTSSSYPLMTLGMVTFSSTFGHRSLDLISPETIFHAFTIKPLDRSSSKTFFIETGSKPSFIDV
jgi:hypothetical protein